MAKAYVHNGSYQSIPTDASPGLRFLKAFLPAVDGVGSLSPFLAPTAVFIINGSDPTPASTITGMMKMRIERLKAFRHELRSAWDVEMGGGRRMVMYETVSVTIFKTDPDEKAVEVAEFSTIELEPMEGGAAEGLAAAVLRTFMDANLAVSRMRQIGGGHI